MAAAAESAAGRTPAAEPGTGDDRVLVDFQTDPSHYRHWRLAIDGPVATLAMDVAEDGGLRKRPRGIPTAAPRAAGPATFPGKLRSSTCRWLRYA